MWGDQRVHSDGWGVGGYIYIDFTGMGNNIQINTSNLTILVWHCNKKIRAPNVTGAILWLKLFVFLSLNTPVVNIGYRWESCGVAIMQWSRSQVHVDFLHYYFLLGSYVGFSWSSGVFVFRLLFSILTIPSFCPHPSILPLRHSAPLAPLERLLSVHFQTPWRSGCSPSSISCVGSETRFWSGAPLNKARLRFRCVCAWSGSGWSETPSPAQVFGNENIFDVLCVCLSRIQLLFRYKVKTLI